MQAENNNHEKHNGEFKWSLEKFTIHPMTKLASLANVENAETAIDIGCGAGGISLYFLRNLFNLKQLYSVDVSEELLNKARKRKEISNNLLSSIKHDFEIGDAQNLKNIPNDSIDFACMNYVLHHVPDPVKAVKEVHRILKPGGSFALGELHHEHRNDSFFGFLGRIFKEVGLSNKYVDPRAHHHNHHHKHETPENFKVQFNITENKFSNLLKQNGFEIQYQYVDQVYYPMQSKEEFQKIILDSQWNQSSMKQLTAEERESVFKRGVEIVEAMKKEAKPFASSFLGIIARKLK